MSFSIVISTQLMLYDAVNLSLPKKSRLIWKCMYQTYLYIALGGKGLSLVIIKTRGEKWKLFFKEESLLRHADRMVELENHYHVTTNRINELEKDYQ